MKITLLVLGVLFSPRGYLLTWFVYLSREEIEVGLVDIDEKD